MATKADKAEAAPQTEQQVENPYPDAPARPYAEAAKKK